MSFSMTTRTGRERQVFEGGLRLVVGCVPIKDNKVLLVSRKNNDWILPKGGWENDETKEQSAAREAWEEAGVRGQIGRFLGEFTKKKSRLSFYLLRVESVEEMWPEMGMRQRKWVNFEEVSSVCTREGMANVIKTAISSLNSFE